MLKLQLLYNCRRHYCDFIDVLEVFPCKVNYNDIYGKSYINYNIETDITVLKKYFNKYICLKNHKNTYTLESGDISTSNKYNPGNIIQYRSFKTLIFNNYYEYNQYVKDLENLNIKFLPYMLNNDSKFYSGIYINNLYLTLLNTKDYILNYYSENSTVYTHTIRMIKFLSDTTENYNNIILIYVDC